MTMEPRKTRQDGYDDAKFKGGSAQYGAWHTSRRLDQTAWIDTFAATPIAHADDEEHYLLKTPRRDLENDAERDRAQLAIVREMLLGTQLRSPYLPTVVDSCLGDESTWLVQPGSIGEPLCEMQTAQFTLPQSLWTIRQIATALDHLSIAGWLHGNVQPRNIHVSPLGHATLVDLGFAREIGTHECEFGAGPVVGSFAYGAPELFGSEEPLTTAADVYSLGTVLFELIAGEHPLAKYAKEEMPAVKRITAVPTLADRNVDLPASLSFLVARMLERQPIRRPTAREVIENLAAIEIANFSLWAVMG